MWGRLQPARDFSPAGCGRRAKAPPQAEACPTLHRGLIGPLRMPGKAASPTGDSGSISRHDADALLVSQKLCTSAPSKCRDILRAQDVGLPIRSSVQDRIIRRIRQHERPHDQRLNRVGIRQVPVKRAASIPFDLIARPQSRIQKHALDLVKNEPRKTG